MKKETATQAFDRNLRDVRGLLKIASLVVDDMLPGPGAKVGWDDVGSLLELRRSLLDTVVVPFAHSDQEQQVKNLVTDALADGMDAEDAIAVLYMDNLEIAEFLQLDDEEYEGVSP